MTEEYFPSPTADFAEKAFSSVFSDHPSTWMRESASAEIREASGTMLVTGTLTPAPRMYSSLAAPPDQARNPSWILPSPPVSTKIASAGRAGGPGSRNESR